MNQIKLSETELYNLIKESVKNILSESEDFVFDIEYNPYDDTKKGNGQTRPLKDNINLDTVRGMLNNALIAFRHKKYEVAKEQVFKIYKLVDAMINQS